MATRAEVRERKDVRIAGMTRRRRRALTPAESTAIGWGAGLLGGIAMALPLIAWDWARSGHVALELPMAATAWLFGLGQFSHQYSLAGSVVVGFLLLCVYWVASGLVFTGIADRMLRARTFASGIAAGLGWGLVSFVLFWYVFAPIARHGAPFHRTADVAPVAPHWVWVLAFVLFGLVAGFVYGLLRTPGPATDDVDELENGRYSLRRP